MRTEDVAQYIYLKKSILFARFSGSCIIPAILEAEIGRIVV
jgi:hypothetical protein